MALALSLILSAAAQVSIAQNTPRETLPMAWADPFPWFYADGTGGVQGFAVDLIEEVGREAGFDIAPFNVATYPERGKAQATGTSAILPAVAPLPHLRDTNLFSDVVMTTEVKLAINLADLSTFDPTDLTGKRVGVVAPGAGSNPELLPGATLFPYPNIDTALLGLLSKEVDALSAEASFVYAEAARARIGARITFVGAPLQVIDRHIAVHETHANLLAPINAAIAAMSADGRLDALLKKHSVFPPEPVPDVLRVGVFELAPYMFFDDSGQASGFAVDVLRDVAETANLALEFVPVDMQDLVPGSSHDILPVISITPERAEIMDFSYPIETSEFSIFMRNGDTEGIKELADLGDLRIGVFEVSLARRMAEAAGNRNLALYGDETSLSDILDHLADSKIDAFLFENTSVRTIIADAGLQDAIAEVTPPFRTTQRAIGLRFGLARIRDKLNLILPSYVVSEKYEALQAKYFTEPVFWTTKRVTWTLALAGLAIMAVVMVALIAQIRSLKMLSESKAATADLNQMAARQGRELETIFNAATSGIVALNRQGQVVRANSAARHMLGGLSEPTPFDWPDEIRFVEAETMQPLENSADPLSRALSGNKLFKETHLLRRKGDGDDRRYVRIDSATLDHEDGDLLVLVIDDVSNEERNRQVVERKSRLDALGQLTGGIAHDFNNLLTTLLYSIVLARRSDNALKREEMLREAEASINRARSLTSRLLSFASKQPGIADSRPAAAIFSDFQNLIRPMLEANIALETEVADANLLVYCDQVQLESALMNLVLNSRDAIMRGNRGHKISLRARAVPGPGSSDATNIMQKSALRYVELSVTDNGPGMDEETLARATDPFFTTKDTNSGTGLGLAMVYGFARQSNGDFRIYSELGVGTTVQLTLARGTESGYREAPMRGEDIILGGGQTVLLVEDEYPILKVASKLLEDIGYVVVPAKSGREALDILQSGRDVDVLLTDVVMPGEFGGFELARRARNDRPDLPVLYMSGYTGFTSSEMGVVVAPLLQKPTPPAELSRALNLALITSG